MALRGVAREGCDIALFRVRLAFGGRFEEGAKLQTGCFGPQQVGKALHVNAKPPGVAKLRDQANIGEGRGDAEAERALALGYERLARRQARCIDILRPSLNFRLRPALLAKARENAKILQRMGIGRQYKGERPDMRALQWVCGEQGR